MPPLIPSWRREMSTSFLSGWGGNPVTPMVGGASRPPSEDKSPHSLLSLLWHLLTVLQEHPWENAGCTLGSGPSTYWGVSPCLIALYIKLMVEALMWQLALLLVLALWSWVNHVTSLGLSFPISSVGRNDANLRLCLWEHLPQILNTNKY